MTAETLRRAAALMRERAEAATPGPWQSGVTSSTHVVAGRGRNVVVTPQTKVSAANTQHIASWHPAVALAVADLLENEANAWQAAAGDHETGGLYPPYNGARAALLTQIARAYLGEIPSVRPERGDA